MRCAPLLPRISRSAGAVGTGGRRLLVAAAAAPPTESRIQPRRGDASSTGGGGGGLTYQRTSFTATAGQTTFTVTYTVANVQVYINGVLLATTEYTSTSGTSIVLGTGAGVGNIVDVITWV